MSSFVLLILIPFFLSATREFLLCLLLSRAKASEGELERARERGRGREGFLLFFQLTLCVVNSLCSLSLFLARASLPVRSRSRKLSSLSLFCVLAVNFYFGKIDRRGRKKKSPSFFLSLLTIRSSFSS